MNLPRCAVIGAGNMGQHHARVYSQIARLAAVCDTDEERGKQVAEAFGARFFSSVKEMIASTQLDCVSIAVPSKYHRAVAEQTLEAGIPTLVEKPIATSIEDADFLMSVAKKRQVSLMVGHIERFNPVIQALKKQLDKDVLGSVVSISAVRSGISPPREKKSHVGLDLTIHDLDICLYLLGEKPVQSVVYGQQVNKDQTVDSLSAMVKFPSAVASFSTNWLSPIKVRKLSLTGTKGYAEVDYIKQTLKIYNRPPKVKNSTYKELQSLVQIKSKRVTILRREPLKNELEFFIKHRLKPDVLRDLATDAVTALKILLQ